GRRGCATTNDNSIGRASSSEKPIHPAENADETSARHCNSGSCVLRRNCCTAARWNTRVGSKTKLSVRVSPNDRQWLALIFLTKSRLSFSSAAPDADRQLA